MICLSDLCYAATPPALQQQQTMSDLMTFLDIMALRSHPIIWIYSLLLMNTGAHVSASVTIALSGVAHKSTMGWVT